MFLFTLSKTYVILLQLNSRQINKYPKYIALLNRTAKLVTLLFFPTPLNSKAGLPPCPQAVNRQYVTLSISIYHSVPFHLSTYSWPGHLHAACRLSPGAVPPSLNSAEGHYKRWIASQMCVLIIATFEKTLTIYTRV